MAKTIQKKVKFSKGQVVPELAERVDLSILDESAQKMKNVVSTVYGGVRTRNGTKYIDKITSLQELEPVSVSSDIFADTSNFSGNEYKVSGAVGSRRVLALLDYGENAEGQLGINIKNVSINPFVLEYTTPGTTTISIPKGTYEISVVGAGGGSGCDYANFSHWHGAAGTGGSGAAFVGTVNFQNVNYEVKVGAGQYGPNGENDGVGGDGEESYIKGINDSLGTAVICTGGTAGSGDYHPEKFEAGVGGSCSLILPLISQKLKANGNNGISVEGEYQWGTWSGGASVYGGYGAGATVTSARLSTYNVPGGNGYVKLEMVDSTITLDIFVSLDGSSWEQVSRETISRTERDITIDLSYRYRYVKIEVDAEGVNSENGISFQYLRADVSSQDGSFARMFPFVYNNKDNYLFVFVDERIQIFKDDVLVQILETPGLEKQFLREIKITQKDDTIVIAYEDFSPKIIKRVDDVFVFSDLEIKDIPYAVFGEEERTRHADKWIKPSGEEGAIKLKSVKDKDNTTEDGPDIFTADMVGQHIDGNGGKVKITEFVNTKEVGGNTVIPFYTSDAFKEWEYISGYEPVWSETRGYPRTCLFASQRLWFGGSKQKPSTIWGSRLGDYFNFKNSGNYDNDSIDVTLLTNNPIVNMMDNRGLHIFTSGEEITANESSLTPSGFSATINTKNGSLSSLNPEVLGDGTCLFVEKNGKSLLSYIYDFNQSSYTTGNLMMLSSVMKNPVSLSLQRNSVLDKGDFLFIVLEDGRMIVNCFLLKENINSLAIFETEGKIKDVCCLVDDVYLLVERKGYTCLEKIQRGINCDSLETRFVDTNIIGGLYRQNGSRVYVWSDTTLYGKFLVEGFSVELPQIPNEKCYIGLAYDSELVGNNLAINGKTTTVKKRITSAEVVCKPEQTKQLIFNGQKKNKKDGIYTFYSCTPYGKEVNFNIMTEFEPFEVYSITLNINYEG